MIGPRKFKKMGHVIVTTRTRTWGQFVRVLLHRIRHGTARCVAAPCGIVRHRSAMQCIWKIPEWKRRLALPDPVWKTLRLILHMASRCRPTKFAIAICRDTSWAPYLNWVTWLYHVPFWDGLSPYGQSAHQIWCLWIHSHSTTRKPS